MPNKSDAQLLRDYAAHGDERAFGEIVARHTDLIYSAALRQCGSPEPAREIAQSAFINLARKARTLAGQLSPDASLAGWLYRGTRYAALTLRRDERRRQEHERLVMDNFNPAADTHSDWLRVAPVLEEAMAELNDADREAVLLRFFKNQDFAAVGLALGVSDDAAQKRVSRAVDRLREILAHRGVTVGASGLVVIISTNAVLIAPAGLNAAITAAAVAGTTIAAVTTTITMTTLQKTLIATALSAAIGMGIYEAHQNSALRTQVQILQQQAPLAEQNAQLTRERDEAARQLAALHAENERLNRNPDAAELLRLRGQVGVLRRELADTKQRVSERAVDTNNLVKRWAFGEIKPKRDWQDNGLSSPLAAVETFWWAAANKNVERMKQCIVFDHRTNAAPVSDLYAKREAQNNAGLVERLKDAGLSIASLSRAQMPSDRAKIETEVSGWLPRPDGTLMDFTDKQELQLMSVNGEWKVIRSEQIVHLTIDDDDFETVAKMMLTMDPKSLEQLKADSRLPLRTLRAYEELKAKAAK